MIAAGSHFISLTLDINVDSLCFGGGSGVTSLQVVPLSQLFNK